MAQLLVRRLDPEIVRRLRARAARHGRSAEAEHREILRRVLAGGEDRSLGDVLLGMPSGGSPRDFERDRARPRKVRL